MSKNLEALKKLFDKEEDFAELPFFVALEEEKFCSFSTPYPLLIRLVLTPSGRTTKKEVWAAIKNACRDEGMNARSNLNAFLELPQVKYDEAYVYGVDTVISRLKPIKPPSQGFEAKQEEAKQKPAWWITLMTQIECLYGIAKVKFMMGHKPTNGNLIRKNSNAILLDDKFIEHLKKQNIDISSLQNNKSIYENSFIIHKQDIISFPKKHLKIISYI